MDNKVIEDYRLKTLANLPISVNGIKVKPKSIQDIVSLGYGVYLSYLKSIRLTKKELLTIEALENIPSHVSIVDIVFIIYQDTHLAKVYKDASRVFLNGEIQYQHETLTLNGKQISKDDYAEILRVLRIQNSLEEENIQEDFNPKSDRVRKLGRKDA